MGTLSPLHWILVAVVLLALFGPKTLVRVGKQAGRGVRAANDLKRDLTEVPREVLRDVPPTRRD